MKLGRRGERGLTFLEVIVAAALLAVIMLAVISATASGQTVVKETSEQTTAMNYARSTMEALLESDWQTQLLPYYKNYLNQTYAPGPSNPPNFFPVPIPGEPPLIDPAHPGSIFMDPITPSIPANKLGQFIVREPLPGECPGYMGGGTHFPQAAFPGPGTIPLPPNPTAPTMLVLIVTVDLDSPGPTYPWARTRKPGQANIKIQLRGMRSYL